MCVPLLEHQHDKNTNDLAASVRNGNKTLLVATCVQLKRANTLTSEVCVRAHCGRLHNFTTQPRSRFWFLVFHPEKHAHTKRATASDRGLAVPLPCGVVHQLLLHVENSEKKKYPRIGVNPHTHTHPGGV